MPISDARRPAWYASRKMARSRIEEMTENRRAISSSERRLISFRLRFALGFWTGGGGRSSSGSRMSSFGGMGGGSTPSGLSDFDDRYRQRSMVTTPTK